MTSEAAIPCQRRPIKPELGVLVFLLDMYVRGFAALSAEEEEPVSFFFEDGWHAEHPALLSGTTSEV